ncbi:sensor histidine kinase [Geoalkalibacter halelectricus]|uniref:histidine kinase n=1 Tax=Geoalkalibacter halelectricus TaxID=2847045 RepID=A0ABY5ZJN6_9BACT|nr:HAMP domain-containing sensor histidine kinase [Geoalkalibacter halelectricus]MDO3377216.1 HAMP domain-containing histidine kinase [Geoalkalibacter halelectricus]UWZ79347.1 HAMP domain-containing histidine kinase [Geoalkalibacter halelectricus]
MFFWPLKRGLSLRISLLLYLVFPLIVVLAVTGYYSLLRLEQQVEKRMQEDIELIARAIRGPLEHSLEHGREGGLAQTLASAFRIGRVYGVYVYDAHGRKIASSGPREPEVHSLELAELAAKGDRVGGYQDARGAQIYSYFVPLSDSVGRNTGLLQLTREGRDFQQDLLQVRHQGILLLSLLSVLLVGMVLFGHHQVIGRNLGSLVKSMARIEKGDRSHRAAERGPREMRHLALGMNAMLDSIARSEKELEQRRHRQIELEQQLQQSRKMAAIGQLAAGVAHELGTPLSVVSGKAQRMLRNPELPNSVAEVFGQIRDAVQRMEHIVRQLLDFGRGNPLRLNSTPLESVAESAAAMVQEEAHAKRVSLSLNGPRPSPNASVDRVRMEQALINLLRNAIQATHHGGRVCLSWFAEEDRLGFAVADDGPGVPEELRDRLFEPFFTTKAVGEGTGLGLSVAQAAARDHGGTLNVGRAEIGGALFTLTLESRD